MRGSVVTNRMALLQSTGQIFCNFLEFYILKCLYFIINPYLSSFSFPLNMSQLLSLNVLNSFKQFNLIFNFYS